jgi:hypothetical protein
MSASQKLRTPRPHIETMAANDAAATLVVNLFGGPGTGKSTAMHGIMYGLKVLGARVECASEYAKDLVYDGSWDALRNQRAILEEQTARVRRFIGKVPLVINEAPIINGLVYTPDDERQDVKNTIRASWASFLNLNFLLTRASSRPYDAVGRYQTAAEALKVDAKIRTMLIAEGVDFQEFDADEAVERIVDLLKPNMTSCEWPLV